VSRLTEPGETLDEAFRLAEQITANAPLAVWASREIVLAADDRDDATLRAMTDEAMGTIMSSDDLREGLMAFIEKRPPVWTGR
jgi:enoyl-CoA hydratase